jgi:(1->4)-alpha-D-glucan 1-alpha-D-glucosylmutase
VPDVYQGAETWYRRLVDPDNRDPVDFGADESVKTTVLRRALAARREHPELFASGAYVPLAVRGRLRRHVVAFARRRGREWAIASVPRLIARFDSPVGEVWRGTRLQLPARAPERWRNAMTGDEVTSLDLADVLRQLPVAILLAANTKRGHSAAARTVK